MNFYDSILTIKTLQIQVSLKVICLSKHKIITNYFHLPETNFPPEVSVLVKFNFAFQALLIQSNL